MQNYAFPRMVPEVVAAYDPIYAIEKNMSAAAAYGLRKLTWFATKAVRVRRSSDDAETDIGFVNGIDLDVASLRAFVGAGSGYVTKWYDQSGNGNHATQSTAANQPRIVNEGVVDVDAAGRPTIQAILASDTHFVVANSASLQLTTNASFSIVHNPNSLGEGNVGRILEKSWYISKIITTKLSQSNQNSNDNCITLSASNINTITLDSNVNQTKFYKNGTLNSIAAGAAYATNTNSLYILNRADGARQYDGKMSELIIFNITVSDAQRQRLERDQGRYFKLAVA